MAADQRGLFLKVSAPIRFIRADPRPIPQRFVEHCDWLYTEGISEERYR
jgi:hypothetical protein